MRDLFRRPDLAPYLPNDGWADAPTGSVRRSFGYQKKVLDNPVMNQDHRNQGLILTADGIPCFKNKNASRGVVPVMARTTMEDALGLNVLNVHMVALVPDQHWEISPITGRKKRIKRKTSVLTCVTTRLTDELLELYETGCWVTDHSLPLGDPLRRFLLRVILLFWIGDYPGIAEVACTMASGGNSCHWCKQFFPFYFPLNKTTHCDFRPHLPPDDSYRHTGLVPPGNFNTTCNDPQPEPKTHQGMCEDAEDAEDYDGAFDDKAHPRFQSGVCYICPLAYLALFDMVWDFMADFMHILEGLIKRHMLEVLKGKRQPAAALLITEKNKPTRAIQA
jgi:hypothetical protein